MILVTGAAGYVGSHIVKRLVEAGQPVRALVRNRTWAQAEGRLANLKIEWAEGDVTKPETLAIAMQGVDTVIHTVAIAIEKGGRKYEAINYQGTVNVVEAAKAAGVKRFINICQSGRGCQAALSFPGLKGQGARLCGGFRPSLDSLAARGDLGAGGRIRQYVCQTRADLAADLSHHRQWASQVSTRVGGGSSSQPSSSHWTIHRPSIRTWRSAGQKY